jgi:cytochrome c biogenesis protein CcmG/thiol:disulfide interchange protein DsbE
MGGKIFFHCLFVIFIFLLNLPFNAEGGEEDLFSKIKISPIKGDKRAPDFFLKDLTGKKVELGQFKGKVIFLNFWATWCSPCKEEMPSMEVLYQQFKEGNFILLAISVDYGGLRPVQEFINKYHYTFPVLLDLKCKTLNLFQVKGIPTTFIIDKKGRMVGKAVGPRDWKGPEVISLINLMLEK